MTEGAAASRVAAARELGRPPSDNSLRDVVALSTLPAIWTGAEPLRIAESLAASVFTMLNPEFVFVSFVFGASSPPVAVAQTGRHEVDTALAEQMGCRVLDWARAHDPDDLLSLELPGRSGPVLLATRPIGLNAELGAIAAAFPTGYRFGANELLLLNVAATQAAVAVQNVVLLQSLRASELRANYAAEELSRRLDELQTANLEIQESRRAAFNLMGEAMQAREAAEALNRELRNANADLEQFAYSASHDLQEPLRTVRIFSQLLAEGARGKLDEESTEYLDNVVAGAARMEALLRDLLMYAQTTRLEPPAVPTDANHAIQAALTTLKGAIAESGASIDFESLPTLPVHPVQLEQLFQNLIGNALKYRRPGVAPEVHITSKKQDAQWVFSVRDNGIGIEEQYKERIFGLFKRLHNGDSYSGTGIGLALCQRIVERHNGRIRVESRPGEGSTFYFTLPA